jgi:anti-sigma-K factor RskA
MTDITDDYRLFASAGGSELDADIAIMTAYLARELSPVQRAAVERRLASDSAFAKTVGPIIDAWKVPLDIPSDDALAEQTMFAEELDAGWARHQAAMRSRERKTQRSRIVQLLRVAAVVALAAIPVVGLAQFAIRWSRTRSTTLPAAPPIAGPASVGDRQSSVGLVSVPANRGAAVSAPSAQQSLPPIRDLALLATRPLTIPKGRIPVIRPLPDGRVFVSVRGTRRLLLVDSAFAVVRVILDSTGNDPRASYGTGEVVTPAGSPAPRGSGIASLSTGGRVTTSLPNHGVVARARGDSTWFVNADVSSLLPIGPDGGIGALLRYEPGLAGAIDPLGASLRRGDWWFSIPPAERYPATPRDSELLLRIPVAGAPDTLTRIKVWVRMQHGGFANPMPVLDDWTVLADGSVAIIRVRDFHVDWIEPDGTRRSTPSIPFNWVRMTDAAKTALGDSVHAYYVANPVGMVVGTSLGSLQVTVPELIPSALLPDSVPPFGENTATSDLDLRVWIRVYADGERPHPLGPGGVLLIGGGRKPLFRTAPPPAPVYYVIDKRGTVVERVRMPAGWTLLGVGARGNVFVYRLTGSDVEIARARVR